MSGLSGKRRNMCMCGQMRQVYDICRKSMSAGLDPP
jgi:hypothetical protein